MTFRRFLLLTLLTAGWPLQVVFAAAGDIHVQGTIVRTEVPGIYRIADYLFRFAEGKMVNGNKFDDISEDALVGQPVDAHIQITPTGYKLTAAVPLGILSAKPFILSPEQKEHLAQSIDFQTGEFRKRNLHEIYGADLNYRATLKETGQVKPGDSALIITMSGSQGDDFKAAMGHFAVGEARVGSDFSLNAEISNFYPVQNDKDIAPGHVDSIDYFGHVISGQQQYRPVFSLVLYGIGKEKLEIVRKNMDAVFTFLVSNPDLKASINYNCTTASCRALENAGFELTGAEQESKLAEALRLRLDVHELQSARSKKILYYLLTNSAIFFPRPAYEQTLKEALQGENIFRVDYIFHGQTPSRRPRGGVAAKGLAGLAAQWLRQAWNRKTVVGLRCESLFRL